MSLVPALEILRDIREDRVVITTMSAARHWPQISHHALDLNYVPSSMGQGTSLAQGIAMASPQQEVIVLNGDGSLLMNLGSLVTICANQVSNITVIVIDNGIYEVTGGQQTAGAMANVDYAAMARAAGFVTVATFEQLTAWQGAATEVLSSPGPRFLLWRVHPRYEDFHLNVPGPIGPRLDRLREALTSC